jgi:hypothetical protein
VVRDYKDKFVEFKVPTYDIREVKINGKVARKCFFDVEATSDKETEVGFFSSWVLRHHEHNRLGPE